MAMVLQFALSIVTAAVTASLAVWLSLRRFANEKWWEKKFEAYTSVFGDLHHMKRDLSVSYEAALEGRGVYEPLQSELSAAYKSANADLIRHRDLGELIFCSASADLIENTVFKLRAVSSSKGKSYFEFLDESLPIVSDALERLKIIAKLDLDSIASPWQRGSHRS